MAPPLMQIPSLTGTGGDLSSSPRMTGTLGLASEKLNLNMVGLPQNVFATIQNARASTTRTLYECKCRVFEEWCVKSHVVPFQCSVPVIWSFLQELLDNWKAVSTIKVYLAAISACHVGFGDVTVGQHPIIGCFMKGACRLRPVSKQLAPSWDLNVVLDALSHSPFEPFEQADLKALSLKTALLLPLASAKRVSDIHAFSAHP